MPSSSWGFSSGFYVSSGMVIPMGIIMPFNDVAANIPSGWTQWTGGANRALKGSTSFGTIGGSTAVGRGTAWEGLHSGTAYTAWMGNSPGSVGDLAGGASGAHSHSFSVNYYPNRRFQVMMKSLVEGNKLPPKTGVLSDVALTGLTDITPTGYILCGASGTSSSNAAASSSVSGCNTTGLHEHIAGICADTANGNCARTNYNQGSHAHSGSAGVTDNIRRYYMGMWTNASAEIEAVPGIYGIWESAIPPEGWALCDGLNGTPDLTNYHIGMDSGVNMGTKTGNGTITTWASLASAGGHTHNAEVGFHGVVGSAYHSNVTYSSHSIGAAASSFEPTNITVVFIKAIG